MVRAVSSWPIVLVAALLPMVLAACGQDGDAQPRAENADGSVVAEAEALAAAISAQTAGAANTPSHPKVATPSSDPKPASPGAAPRRRDGLWDMASYAADGSLMARQSLCVGAASEDKYGVWDQLTIFADCSRKDLARSGTSWTFHTRCELMGVVNESKGTISGNFNDQFRVDQTIVTDGRPKSGSIRGVHKGACAPFKPGDLIRTAAC